MFFIQSNVEDEEDSEYHEIPEYQDIDKSKIKGETFKNPYF